MRAIDDVENHSQKIGRHSERAAASLFEEFGFGVVLTVGQGPDITLSKDGETLTCEVKTVSCVAKKAGFIYLSAAAVRPMRKNDDLIALVFKDGRILIEKMTDHLSLCSSSGYRHLGRILENAKT